MVALRAVLEGGPWRLCAAACPFGRIHGDGYPAFFIEDTGIICVACDPFNYWAMGLEDFADIGALQANPFGVSEQCLVFRFVPKTDMVSTVSPVRYSTWPCHSR
jgi:hypothetical protein